MATKRKSSRSTKSRGVTLYGVVLGLLLGLAAAVAVALFVTQVPMPFADKASRNTPTILLPDVRDAPDPNLGLHGRGGAVPGTGVTPSIVPPPTTPAEPDAQTPDNLGNLIARLDKDPAPVEEQVATPNQVATPSPPAATPASPPAGTASQGTYYLQAGAFRGVDDAEAMRARVIMLGLSARVEAANVNGTTVHRVRVGPFKGLDEMNQARSRLGGEKIETSVVRQ